VVKRHIRRFAILALGWTLIGLGVLGLFLPFLQGILFILLGLYVLSRESETARHWLHKVREKHPSVDEKLERWGTRWRGRFHKSDRGASSRDEG